MIFGQATLGLFIPIGLILALPTMVEVGTRNYPGQELHVNNMSAGIFNTFNGIGEVIGPLYGATAYERMGFRSTSDTVTLICFAYALLFFMLGLEPFVSSQLRDRHSPINLDYNSKDSINKHKLDMKKRCRSDLDIGDAKTFASESLLSVSRDDQKSLRTPQQTKSTRDNSDTNSFRSDSTLRQRRKRQDDYVILKSERASYSRPQLD